MRTISVTEWANDAIGAEIDSQKAKNVKPDPTKGSIVDDCVKSFIREKKVLSILRRNLTTGNKVNKIVEILNF